MAPSSKKRDTSRLANCYHAILVIYVNALRAHLRATLTQRFGVDGATRELQVTLRERWEQLQQRAKESEALGRDGAADAFDLLEVGDLDDVIDKYFYAAHPDAGGADSARIKRAVLGRMAFIKEERNVIAHPAGGDLDWDAAVAVINSVKRVLRSFHLKEPRLEAQKLLDALFEELVPSRSDAAPTLDDFRALWDASHRSGGSYEAFLKPLMEMLQAIADDFAEMDREPWIELQPGEVLSDFALHWNTAPENVVLAIQDWLIHGNAGGERMERLRRQVDDLRNPPDE